MADTRFRRSAGRYRAFAIGLAAAAMLASHLPAHAAEQALQGERLVVAADEWCPYNCRPGSERPGYLIDVLRAVFEPQGMQVEYRVMPWKRALFETRTGRIDAAVGAVTGDHGDNLIGEESLGSDDTVLVVRRGERFDYRGPGSLDGRVIGVVADYTYDADGPLDAYLARRREQGKGLVIIRREHPLRSLFAMLARRRVDVFPENRYVARYAMADLGHLENTALVETGVGDRVYIAFTPSPRGVRLLGLLDEGVRRLKASGGLVRIMARYGIDTGP